MPKVLFSKSARLFLAASALLATILPLAGCGPLASKSASVAVSGGANNSTSGYTPAAIGGIVHGGQQPIIGSSVQLYQVSTNGPDTAATPLLSSPVVTDPLGRFSITGKYSCSSSTSLVYLVATGGDPGSGTANNSIVMIGALGPCGSISANTSVVLNEVTTAAAAFALNSFMSGATNVGYSGDQSAILAAFNNVQSYANTSNGTSSNSDIVSVANLMAACVNGSSTVCGNILGQTGGGGNILTSMLYMSRHSLSEFANLFTTYIQPNAPFNGNGGNSGGGSTGPGCTTLTMTTLPSFTVTTSGGVSTATIHGMAGATFYHTTDGSPVSSSSSTATTFTVKLDDVIELMATLSCYYPAYYDATTDAPVIADAKGSFTVTTKSTTSYFYTLDGSQPTTKSTPYKAADVVTPGAQDTFTVLAKAPGYKPAYSNLNSATPLISINGTTVTLTDPTDASKDGASELTYGLNGPTSTLMPYPNGGFTVAIADVAYGCVKAVGRGLVCSMLESSGDVTPTITNGSLTFTKSLADATIFYTKNGAPPTLTGLQYSGSSVTLAVADVLGYAAKAPGRSWTTFMLPPIPAPVVTLNNGVATMTDDFANATIYFTTDGTQPTTSSHQYVPPSYTPALTDVLTARAKAPGYQYSYWYTSMLPTPTTIPTFSYSPSTGLTTMSVPGDTAAQIFYTKSGSTPSMSSLAYSGPFAANIADIYLMVAKSPGKPVSYVSPGQFTTNKPQSMWAPGGILSYKDPGDGRQFFYVTNPYNGYGSPTLASTHYTGPFRVYPYTWVTAMAKIPGYAPTVSNDFSLDAILGDIETLGSCGIVANGLAADRVGNVYAACADSASTENIYKFGPTGDKSGVLFSFPLTNASTTPLGITVTPGGTLYVPDPNAGGVHRFMNGTHTFVTTPGLQPDHVFTQQWEQVYVLDGNRGYQIINPGSTTATALTDGHAPTACVGGLLNNASNGGIYCASANAYLGASYLLASDGHTTFTDQQSITVPGLIGGLALAVNGDMYLTTRSSSTKTDSALFTIHPRASSTTTPSAPLQLTNGRTVMTSIDGSPLTSLTLNNPMGITSDPTGNIYVGEGTGAIRRLREAQTSAPADVPSISFSSGSFHVSCTTADAVLYYTLDGSIPTKGAWAFLADFGTSLVNAAKTPASSLNTVGYTMKVPADGVIPATSGQTIQVIAVKDAMFDSGVASATAP